MLDRLFTRVRIQRAAWFSPTLAHIGVVMVLHLWQMNSSDNLEGNLSTFALEMQETAFILDVATANSLVLIDELGRGYAHVSSPVGSQMPETGCREWC